MMSNPAVTGGEALWTLGKKSSIVLENYSQAKMDFFFPEVTEIATLFRIVIRNSDMKTIEFPKLQKLDLNWFVISNCPNLVNIAFPQLKDGQSTRLNLMGTPSLSDVATAKLKKLFPSSHSQIEPKSCQTPVKETKVNAHFIKTWSKCEHWLDNPAFSGGSGYLDIASDVTQPQFDEFVSSLKYIGPMFRLGIYNNHHITSFVFPNLEYMEVKLVAIRNCRNLVNVSFPKLIPGTQKGVKLGISDTPSVNMRSLDELDILEFVRLKKT